jgi:hypothetical protein
VSGKRTIMLAHSGAFALTAGSKATVGAHPARVLTPTRIRQALAIDDALTQKG